MNWWGLSAGGVFRKLFVNYLKLWILGDEWSFWLQDYVDAFLGFIYWCFLNPPTIIPGQGVGCALAFWGRKYTRMVWGQGRKYTRMVLARVARVTASSVHAVRGLICTRGQGPRLYTRNGFAVCTPLFLQLCILCAPCVQVVRFITML